MRRRTSLDRQGIAVSRRQPGTRGGLGTALHTVVCSAAIAAAACAGDPPPPEVDGIPPGEVPERWQAGVGIDEDTSGDLRPEALDIIDDHESGDDSSPGGGGPGLNAATWVPPTTIRVWRRGLDHSTASCSGRVDVIGIEAYVKGVLPHEWIRSWHSESLKAGAIAIRTYAASWIKNGGKYTCADVDDTTASQVYKDERFTVTDAAVDATAGAYVMKDGNPVFAEYSAENGNPTATGVSEPVCAGKVRNGHGRGACQWGTQRWASQQSKTATWMMQHYYPGATVQTPGEPPPPPPTGGEIVVDSNDADNDAAIARIELSGTWTASTATAGYHGSDYRWAATEATSAPATFWFFLDSAQTRAVDAWWVAGTNRSTAATFIAYDAGGHELGRVATDQQVAGGRWNTLGSYAFTAGWNRVALSRWQAAGSVVIADAIRVH